VGSHQTHTTEMGEVSMTAVDTASVGIDDDENVLIYVLCGAGAAVLLIAVAGAVFVSCRKLSSEDLPAPSDPPRSAHVFRAPIQRVHTMVSVRSSESPKRSRSGRLRSSGTGSIDTFFCQQLPSPVAVIKEFALAAAEAGNEHVGPRAPARATLQAIARSYSPAPVPPRISTGVPGVMDVPGTVGEP
jgi:hypothetical protein